MKSFWSKDSSVKLTSVLIKAAMVMLTISLFIMPWAAKYYESISVVGDKIAVPLMVTFYLCAVCGYIILAVLLKLIHNIAKSRIFVQENVKYLWILSNLCFLISLITLYLASQRILAFVLTFAAAFFGLILRVIKNCFNEAVAMREENDLTV